MPFVNETIAEVDRPKYEAYGFKSPFRNELVPSWRWAIDRERDVFLVSLGGQGAEHSEIPMIYRLVWKGEIIRFHAFSKGRGNAQIGVELWWNVVDIVIPEHLKPKQAEIYQLIREALEQCGQGFNRKYVKTSHIGIQPDTSF